MNPAQNGEPAAAAPSAPSAEERKSMKEARLAWVRGLAKRGVPYPGERGLDGFAAGFDEGFAAGAAASAHSSERVAPPFTHARSCPALNPQEDTCTCGLEWRIRLGTEQQLHAAWRKRADEAEASGTKKIIATFGSND